MKPRPRLRSLTQQTLSGFFWQSGAAGANLVVRALVLIVLARFLPAHNFGIIAAAMVVAHVAEALTQMGIGKAMVQRQTLSDEHIASGFNAMAAMGAAATALVAVGAPLLAAPFRLEGLEPIIRLLSVLLLINGVAAVPVHLIYRARRFRVCSAIDVSSFLIGYGGVGFLLTLLGFGVWSLAWAQVAYSAIRMALFMLAARPVLGFRFDPAALRDLFSVGTGFSVGQVGVLVATQVDYFVVGRMLGAEALGLYSRAYQFLMVPAQLVGTAAQTVLFSSIASIQDQPERVARTFLRGTGLVAMVTLPLSGLLMILGPELVYVTLGPGWKGMTVPFQILIASLLFRTSYKISDSVSLALGSMGRRAWRLWVYAAAVASGAWLGSFWGLEGVTVGVGAAVALNFLMILHLALKVTNVPASRVLALHLRHAAAAVPIVAAAWVSVIAARADGLHAVAVGVVGLTVAGFMAVLLWWRFRWIYGEDGEWAQAVATARFAPLLGRLPGALRTVPAPKPAAVGDGGLQRKRELMD